MDEKDCGGQLGFGPCSFFLGNMGSKGISHYKSCFGVPRSLGAQFTFSEGPFLGRTSSASPMQLPGLRAPSLSTRPVGRSPCYPIDITCRHVEAHSCHNSEFLASCANSGSGSCRFLPALAGAFAVIRPLAVIRPPGWHSGFLTLRCFHLCSTKVDSKGKSGMA